MMLRSLNQQPKFYLADNYVGRFLDLWFLLLLFTSNYIIHKMFGKWAGASQEEIHEQSWDEYIFPRFP